jgi:hypothetical protein
LFSYEVFGMGRTKDAVRDVPGVGAFLAAGRSAVTRRTFPGSATYWERRYAEGGSSGQGSLGALASYKAEVLNSFVAEHHIDSVVEFGCGDGNQLSLSSYPRYTGLDVSPSAIDLCSRRFRKDPTKSFLSYDPQRFVNHGAVSADLALSLDVIYHLVEDAAFELHLQHLFHSARRFVVIYSTDFNRPQQSAHVRHRRFTPEVAATQTGWRLAEKLANPLNAQGTEAEFHVYAPQAS